MHRSIPEVGARSEMAGCRCAPNPPNWSQATECAVKQHLIIFLLGTLGSMSTSNAESAKVPEACGRIASLSNTNELLKYTLPSREPTQEERAELAKQGADVYSSIIDVPSHLGRESFRYYRHSSRYGSCRNPSLRHFDKPSQPEQSAAELVSKFEEGPCGWQAFAKVEGATHLLLYGNDNHLHSSVNLSSPVPEFCQYVSHFEPDQNAVCPIDSGSRESKAVLDERWLSQDNPFAVYFDNADFYESISSTHMMRGPVSQILARRIYQNDGILEDYRLVSHDGSVNEVLTKQLNALTRSRLMLQGVYDQSDGALLLFDNNPYMTKSVRVKLSSEGGFESCETPMIRTLAVMRSGLVNW